jgi:exodeoxyribonuclease-3
VRLPHLLDWLGTHQPDLVLLQESKLTDDKFPHAELEAAGYRAQCFGQKTYNGVALLSKRDAADVVRNIPGFADDMARVITATVDRVCECAIDKVPRKSEQPSDYAPVWLRLG